MRPRALRQRYDSAQTNDANRKHWSNADALSANAGLDARVRATLRNRARYEVANDCYASGMVTTLANDTIGTGPVLQVLGLPKEEAKQVEQLFWQWSVAVKMTQKLRTMRRAKAVDGESFASFFTNRALRHPVRVDLQLHEAEMITSPITAFGEESLTDGIIFDDFGNVAAYTLLKEHPGDGIGAALEYETVRAADMIHLFNADRPGQARGCPELSPSLPILGQRRRYALAVLRAAEIAAMHSGVIHTQASPDDPDELEPLDSIELEHGMFPVMPKGWTIQQMKAEQPTALYDMTTKAYIRELARPFCMPLAVAAGDSSGYNFSSSRMDKQVYWKAIGVEHAVILEPVACDRIFAQWWAEARLLPGYLPPTASTLRDPVAHIWRWDGSEHVDPQKEATAQTIRLSNGTSNRAAEYAREGKDVDDEDEVAARTYGVTVPEYRKALFTKQIGVPAAQQDGQKRPDEDDDEQEDKEADDE